MRFKLHLFNVVFLFFVLCYSRQIPTDKLKGEVGLLAAAAGDDDGCALLGEEVGGGFANSGGGSSDDSYFVVEVKHMYLYVSICCCVPLISIIVDIFYSWITFRFASARWTWVRRS